MRILKVATCSLNQWAMDFDNNMKNIKESILRAKEAGATIRLGPELEITGYGCEDHFLEQDTVTHAWQCLKELLSGDWTDGILCSFGMPIVRDSERYNCQIMCLNRKILMIRPKMWLANGGGCAELRWFTAWKQKGQCLNTFFLPTDIGEALNQTTVPFGYGYIRFLDTAVAAEICMELFSCIPLHPQLALSGVEVFMNASGSLHQMRRMRRRLRTITEATHGRGGVYMYSNQLGCDGGRGYYDGCSCIVVNGVVVAHGVQFSLKEVDMVVAQIDLDQVTNLRASNSSFQEQASSKVKAPHIFVPYKLCWSFTLHDSILSQNKSPSVCCFENEIALGPACWLWNHLRRSGASGFLLPLSGGVGSLSVAAIVGSMCQLVVTEIANGNEQVKADAMRIGHYTDGQFPTNCKELANRIFYTIYMGSEHSSDASRNLLKSLLMEEIGSRHFDVSIDSVVSSLLSVFKMFTGRHLPNKEGGITLENAKEWQTIRSRIKMMVAYLLATLLPWAHNKPGFYLVLSSTTADDGLCGNLTKYGCSGSGDLNPVGNISTTDLQSFLKWAPANLGFSSLSQAEVSTTASESQQDEQGTRMTDEEFSISAKLRKISRCGPVSMFKNLCYRWRTTLTPSQIADKVKRFFKQYAIHRHKMTVLTPSFFAEGAAPEDNRFDQRPFLYNSEWSYQFREIDRHVQQMEGDGAAEIVFTDGDC